MATYKGAANGGLDSEDEDSQEVQEVMDGKGLANHLLAHDSLAAQCLG